MTCVCRCGYTCFSGGRRVCSLDLMACIKAHYKVDCGHVWDGPWVESTDGAHGSTTCSKCGMTSMDHGMAVGP